MSRLQAGALEVHEEVVVLDEVLAEAVASIGAGRVRGRPRPARGRCRRCSATRRCSSGRFANIIANAVAYSRGEPVLRARRAGARTASTCASPTAAPASHRRSGRHIFLPFRRLGDTRRHEGVGLGLAIAKGFVEAMGGTIEADDTPGGGLTIVVRLKARR